MNRRTFIGSTGAIIATGSAGCVEEESSGGDGGDGGDGSGGNQSTPTQQQNYGIGESFTVGSGDRTVEYVVNSVSAYNAVGGEYTSEEASGVWAVVVLEMTNETDETVNISSNHLKLVDKQDRQFDADAGASVYVDSDPRIQAEGLAFEQLNPGLTTSGAVLYDVSPATSYELMVEPLGVFSSASSKRVDLGEITAP